jgi:NhaP-type Na+/H+ or K+/H+ antiporter
MRNEAHFARQGLACVAGCVTNRRSISTVHCSKWLGQAQGETASAQVWKRKWTLGWSGFVGACSMLVLSLGAIPVTGTDLSVAARIPLLGSAGVVT